MTRWFVLTAAALLCACNVASVREAPDTIAYNTCESTAECSNGSGSDSYCDSKSHQCRATNTDFKKILFEVTPPADVSAIAGVQYLVTRDNLSSDADIDLELAAISQVTGKVVAPGRKCDLRFLNDKGLVVTSADNSVPMRVLLTPSTTSLGLASPRVGARSNTDDWTFAVNVPPGTYDVYLEPSLSQPDESCVVPPQLVREYKIEAGTISLKIDLPEPSTFDLEVAWSPDSGTLEDWTVEMLDPSSGRVISNRVPLLQVAADDYRAHLLYSAVTVDNKPDTKQQDPLLRLAPPQSAPDSLALPTVVMARSALAVFEATGGKLTNFTSLPAAVHVHGQVNSEDTPKPAPATVTLVATKLSGIAPGVLASFVRTVTTDKDGQFDAYLLPGQYAVSTVPLASLDEGEPTGSALAADARIWTVPGAPYEQAGKVIALGSAFNVTGLVTAANEPVAAALVQAVASPQSIQYDPLQNTLGSSTANQVKNAFIPRASAGRVNSNGDFKLKADFGKFDISVRPNADTGFAWLVMPNVEISPIRAGLARLSMSMPVSYRGTVTVPGSPTPVPVPSALIRAYIYLKKDDYTGDAENADSVLQIAETRADVDGSFNILVPAKLNHQQPLPQ
jgi:hypothetical protein